MCPSSTSSSDAVNAYVDADSLVVVPEDVKSSPARMWRAWALVVLFLALIVGTGLIDTLRPVPEPELLGNEKIAEDQLRANAHWLDGSKAKLIEREIKLRSRVRDEVTKPYTIALLRLLNEANEDLLVGRDHWLFLRVRALPHDIPDEQMTGLASATLGALQRRLAQLGVRMVVVPVPRKEVLASEFLPSGVDVHPLIEPSFTADLTRRGVENVDLLAALKAQGGGAMYFKYGSHWTDRAQLIAAELIAKQIGLWRPEEERRSVVEQLPNDVLESDLLNLLGAKQTSLSWFNADGACEAFDTSPVRNPAAADKPAPDVHVAIVGTSFTWQRKLAQFLQHFMTRQVFSAAQPGVNPIDSMRDFLTKRRDRVLPDILLVEVPIHAIFSTVPFPAAAELFASFPVAGTTRVLNDSRWSIPPEVSAGAIELHDPWRDIALVAPHMLAHTGQGVASVVLHGSVTGGTMEVQVRHAYSFLVYDWPAGQSELIMPLIAATPTSDAWTIAARAKDATPTTFDFELAELVVLGDEKLATTLECGPLQTRDGGWMQEMRPTSAYEVPRLGMLWIDTDAKAPITGSVELEVEFDGGKAPIVAKFDGIEARAWLLIDLGAGAGAHLQVARIHAAGQAPSKAAVRARVLPPFEALEGVERKGPRRKR